MNNRFYINDVCLDVVIVHSVFLEHGYIFLTFLISFSKTHILMFRKKLRKHSHMFITWYIETCHCEFSTYKLWLKVCYHTKIYSNSYTIVFLHIGRNGDVTSMKLIILKFVVIVTKKITSVKSGELTFMKLIRVVSTQFHTHEIFINFQNYFIRLPSFKNKIKCILCNRTILLNIILST
jgi:hypothetical protein